MADLGRQSMVTYIFDMAWILNDSSHDVKTKQQTANKYLLTKRFKKELEHYDFLT